MDSLPRHGRINGLSDEDCNAECEELPSTWCRGPSRLGDFLHNAGFLFLMLYALQARADDMCSELRVNTAQIPEDLGNIAHSTSSSSAWEVVHARTARCASGTSGSAHARRLLCQLASLFRTFSMTWGTLEFPWHICWLERQLTKCRFCTVWSGIQSHCQRYNAPFLQTPSCSFSKMLSSAANSILLFHISSDFQYFSCTYQTKSETRHAARSRYFEVEQIGQIGRAKDKDEAELSIYVLLHALDSWQVPCNGSVHESLRCLISMPCYLSNMATNSLYTASWLDGLGIHKV